LGKGAAQSGGFSLFWQAGMSDPAFSNLFVTHHLKRILNVFAARILWILDCSFSRSFRGDVGVGV
jgi:hypothetical protein